MHSRRPHGVGQCLQSHSLTLRHVCEQGKEQRLMPRDSKQPVRYFESKEGGVAPRRSMPRGPFVVSLKPTDLSHPDASITCQSETL